MIEPPVFSQSLAILAKEGVDPLKDSFAGISPVISKLGTGKAVAVLLAAMFAKKVIDEHGAFWFTQREAPLGAALGFPDVFLTLFPVKLAEAALAVGDVGTLDEHLLELRDSLNRNPAPSSVQKLGPAQYQELLDPELVNFVIVDEDRVKRALALTAGQAVDTLRVAIRMAEVSPQIRDAVTAAWITPMQQLDSLVPLQEQIEESSRAIERFVRMFATKATGAPAAESFWIDKVFNSAELKKDQVFGVFSLDTTRPLISGIETPRIYAVNAAELQGKLDDGDALADKWRAELHKLCDTQGTLAFVRSTIPHAAQEANAAAVMHALSQVG